MIPFHARLNMCPHNLSIIYHVVARLFVDKLTHRLLGTAESTVSVCLSECVRVLVSAWVWLGVGVGLCHDIAHTSAKLETKA